MADKYPRPFGRYHLLAPLAQGGMGALYLACVGDRGLERLCVIKTVLPHLADPEYVARFRDEAKVVVRLSHGNLVPVFDAGMVDGELYLAMDYVDGKDLRAVWNRCAKKGIAFPIDVAVHIVRELCRGLHHAHDFGGIKLVHRDVSPPNVLLSFAGEVKLTDFGLASSTLKLEKTAPGIIYGKISYMSPEQARGEPIDCRTDIYAAGIILWELLTGRQLFPQSEGPDLIERVRHPKIEPPSARAPRVPPMLDQIVLRALAPNADDRYQTGEQYRAALAAFLASNREYVATDAARVAAFLKDLFEEDIARERAQRQELLETLHERLEENRRSILAERAAAAEKAQRKADLLAAIERQGDGGGHRKTQEGGQFREDDLSGRILEQLSANDTDKLIGSVIERWKIVRKIGEGGMGRVFEAEHTEIGRRVAIKILHPVYSRTPEVVARFRMEARAASRIGHPNIVEVTDSGTTADGAFYFVMELLEGVDLADTLSRETRLPVTRALSISLQVANALCAAHQINIVHRDLKPENIYLIRRESNSDFVKILDFGIAKSLEEEKIRLTSPGMAMGTPEYMAPEQAAGKGCDARSDIYSLGAIMYEMLSGRAPIEGENLMEILMRKATEDPVDLATLRPETAGDVSRLVMRALARDPADRPQTMEEFAAEIRRCLSRLLPGAEVPLPTPPVQAESRTDADVSRTPPPDREDAALAESGRRQWRQVAWVSLFGAMAGLGAALYVYLTPAGSDPDPPRPRTTSAPTPLASVQPGRLAAPRQQEASPVPTPKVEPASPPQAREAPRSLLDGLKMPPPIDLAQARARIEEGRLAINSGRYETAFRLCYDSAGNPQVRALALTCMGEAEFARGNYQRAIQIGRRALKEKPGKDVYLLLGNAYFKTHNCREATNFVTRVLTGSDSSNPEAQRVLELCARQK
ncbi:MAG: protein kinase [Myxococcales bacterium]|nr:protein kinase [Myxococcota bacterium]MDW8280893.1 protein kinase [Myxococcales bacterium]